MRNLFICYFNIVTNKQHLITFSLSYTQLLTSLYSLCILMMWFFLAILYISSRSSKTSYMIHSSSKIWANSNSSLVLKYHTLSMVFLLVKENIAYIRSLIVISLSLSLFFILFDPSSKLHHNKVFLTKTFHHIEISWKIVISQYNQTKYNLHWLAA